MKYDKAIESISNERNMSNGPHQCEICGDQFDTHDQLKNHAIDKGWDHKSDEAFTQTGGQYPSMEDDSDDYSFGMPASSPKYASKLKKNYHDNKTHDMSTLNDDANNIGNVDEELKSNELNEWDKPDTLNQKPDKAPLDVDAEPQQEQVEPTMGQESTGYKCRACGLYASSEDSANKHEDQFGKDHKMYYGDVYSKDEEALEAEQDKKYKCTDCKYSTEFPESFKMHARGQHDMGENQINNIIGEVALEAMASDCGCDKGKEKFYKPIFESLGVDWAFEIEGKCSRCGNQSNNLKNTLGGPICQQCVKAVSKTGTTVKGGGQSQQLPRDYTNEAEDDTYCPVCGDKYNGDIEYYNHMKNKHPYRSQNLKKPSVEAKGVPKGIEPLEPDSMKSVDDMTPEEVEEWQKEHGSKSNPNPGFKPFNESFISEWDGMNTIQRHEWLNNKVGVFEMLDKYVGVSNLKFKNQDMASQERLLKLAESNTYSYNFKKKVNVEYYRDPADFPDPHPKSACDICKTQYQDHGDKGDKVSPSIKDEYDLNFDTWDHDWEGEGDYDDSDEQYERMRDNKLGY